jgi:hypothetical protein
MIVVIGRYPIYLKEAEKLGGKKFNIPQDEWVTMLPSERWASNKKFLDEAIAAGDKIVLTTAPEKVPAGSTLEKELNYLASCGWLPRQVDGGWEIAPS